MMNKPQDLQILALGILMAIVITSCTDDVSKFDNDTETDTTTDSTVSDDDTDTLTMQDSESEEAKDSDTATVNNTEDSETSVDTETATPGDTGEDTGTVADTETVTNADTETAVEADTATESDTTPDGLFIQAECAIKNDLSVCTTGTPSGSISAQEDTLGWITDPTRDPQTYPTFTSDQQLGYTAGGAWFAFDGIDLGQYTTVTIQYASAEDVDRNATPTGFRVHLDSVDGTEIAFIETDHTGGWQNYQEATATLSSEASGTHTVFFVAEVPERNNGNVDWVNFHN